MSKFLQLRRQARISQNELAQIVGIDPKLLSMFELGKATPSNELSRKIFEGIEQILLNNLIQTFQKIKAEISNEN